MDAATFMAPDGDQDTGRRAEGLRKFIVPLQESNTVIERVSPEHWWTTFVPLGAKRYS